jgi:hypothetical protein
MTVIWAAIRLSNFTGRDAGGGVFVGENASMRNGCEVEPWEH